MLLSLQSQRCWSKSLCIRHPIVFYAPVSAPEGFKVIMVPQGPDFAFNTFVNDEVELRKESLLGFITFI